MFSGGKFLRIGNGVRQHALPEAKLILRRRGYGAVLPHPALSMDTKSASVINSSVLSSGVILKGISHRINGVVILVGEFTA